MKGLSGRDALTDILTLQSGTQYLVRWRRLPVYTAISKVDYTDPLQTSAWVIVALNGKTLGEGLVSDLARGPAYAFPPTTMAPVKILPSLDRTVSSAEITGQPLWFDAEDPSHQISSSGAVLKVGKLTVTLHRSPEVLRRALKTRTRSDVVNIEPSKRQPVAGTPPASVAPTIFTFWVDLMAHPRNLQQARSAPSLRNSISITWEKLKPGMGRRASLAFVQNDAATDTAPAKKQGEELAQQPSDSLKRTWRSSVRIDPASKSSKEQTLSQDEIQPRPSLTISSKGGRLHVVPAGRSQSSFDIRRSACAADNNLHLDLNAPPQAIRPRATTIQTPLVPSQPLRRFEITQRNDSDPLSFSSLSGGSLSVPTVSTPSPAQMSTQSAKTASTKSSPSGPGNPTPKPAPSRLAGSAATVGPLPEMIRREMTVSESSFEALGYARSGLNPLLHAGMLARAHKQSIEKVRPLNPSAVPDDFVLPPQGTSPPASSDSMGRSSGVQSPLAVRGTCRQDQALSPLKSLSSHQGSTFGSTAEQKGANTVVQDFNALPSLASSAVDDGQEGVAIVPHQLESREKTSVDNVEATVQASLKLLETRCDGDALTHIRGYGLLTPVAEESDRESLRRLSQALSRSVAPSRSSVHSQETPALPLRASSLTVKTIAPKRNLASINSQNEEEEPQLEEQSRESSGYDSTSCADSRSPNTSHSTQLQPEKRPRTISSLAREFGTRDSIRTSQDLFELLDRLSALREREAHLVEILQNLWTDGTLASEVQHRDRVVQELSSHLRRKAAAQKESDATPAAGTKPPKSLEKKEVSNERAVPGPNRSNDEVHKASKITSQAVTPPAVDAISSPPTTLAPLTVRITNSSLAAQADESAQPIAGASGHINPDELKPVDSHTELSTVNSAANHETSTSDPTFRKASILSLSGNDAETLAKGGSAHSEEMIDGRLASSISSASSIPSKQEELVINTGLSEQFVDDEIDDLGAGEFARSIFWPHHRTSQSGTPSTRPTSDDAHQSFNVRSHMNTASTASLETSAAGEASERREDKRKSVILQAAPERPSRVKRPPSSASAAVPSREGQAYSHGS